MSSAPAATKPVVLNQSGLKEYQNCQRLYGWRRVAGLEPVGRRSAPEIGTAVHAGLAVVHAPNGTLEAALEATTSKLEERIGPGGAFEDKSGDESKEIATKVLSDYVAFWGGREDVWKPLNQEVQFIIEIQPGWAERVYYNAEPYFGTGTAEDPYVLRPPLPKTGVFLRGRLDNLSIHAGALWIVDYKTAGRMDPRDLLKYEMDTQLTAYIYGVSKQLSEQHGEPVRIEGAIIDLLVKTKVSQFAREKYTRAEAELVEFENEFVEIGARLREQHLRVDAGEDWKVVFPKSTEHCFRYGTCPMRDLCLHDTPIRRALYNPKSPDYVDEAWAELTEKWQKENA